MHHRFLAGTAVVSVLLGAGLFYDARSPRSDAAYREEAVQTLESLQSQVQTARLWGEQLEAGRSPLRTVRVAMAEVESDATSSTDQFAAYQPPEAERPVRRQVLTEAREVLDRLGELRVLARSSDGQAVIDHASRLGTLSEEVSRTTERVRR